MLKDISSEPEITNVPALEPEKIAVQTDDFDDLEKAIEENTEKEIKEEIPEEVSVEISDETDEEVKDEEPAVSPKKTFTPNIKLPELEIPESMKNMGLENPLHTEIPKAPDICLPGIRRRIRKRF